MAKQRTRIDELSIFTIGLGVIISLFSIWASFILQPAPGTQRSLVGLAFPVGLGLLYVILGVLTKQRRNVALVIVTLVAVCGGLLVDLVLDFSVIKVVVNGILIACILKFGLDGLAEAGLAIGGRKIESEESVE